MKPVGLVDPRTGREPYAAVQLRQENLMADAYSMVGFQNHLRYGEQARVLRLIPGLERAEFLQFDRFTATLIINAPRGAGGNHAGARASQTSSLPGKLPGVRRLCRVRRDGLVGGQECRAALKWRRTLIAPAAYRL